MSTTTAARPDGLEGEPEIGWPQRLYRRELVVYPERRQRLASLAIVVLCTVLFYYQYNVLGAVGDGVIAGTGMSFFYFVMVNVVSVFASAVTSVFGGITDRYGRANIVVVGVLGCALVCLLGFPHVNGALSVAILYAVLGAFEGIVLVATPALVRDFSPQLGRATAMGFWTIGPVAGSLMTAAIVTPTVDRVDRWQDEYVIAGWVGIGVFLIALFFLRELSAPLRDQIVVSEHEAVLADARARGIDTDVATRSPMRQMLKLDILVPAAAISVFLITYFAAVGFLPIFFQTTFGYSASRANSLGNWMWGAEVVALVIIGWMSDKLGVRKPFMLVGALGAIATTAVMMRFTTDSGVSYTAWAIDLSLLTFFLGMAFAPWMASFTETVERRNPALTATGLSLWGAIVRFTATAVTFVLPFMVGSATTLIQDGPRVQSLAAGQDASLTARQNAAVRAVAADPSIAARAQALSAKYKSQLATATALSPTTQAKLAADPTSNAAQVAALSELTKLSESVVGRVIALNQRYGNELATAGAIDSLTQITLLNDPTSEAATRKAAQEIAAKFGVSAKGAEARLAALAKVPSADLVFMSANGTKVEQAGAKLTALGRVPASALTFLDKWSALGDPSVQTALRYLGDTGPKVQKAVDEGPGEWNDYWLLGLIGEIVFIPAIFLMVGYWSPKRARKAAAEHEQLVDAELRRLAAEAS